MAEDDDDDFEALFDDFNSAGGEDFFEEADSEFLTNISTNLRVEAGIDHDKEHSTNWVAPTNWGLDNSGLAREEAVASAKRREIAEGDDKMWNELASSPPRQYVERVESYPNTEKKVRQPSGELHVMASSNLIEAINAEARRLTKKMAEDTEKAALAAGAFDALAGHARAAPRLSGESLQRVMSDVAATGDDGKDLLRLAVERREIMSPEKKGIVQPKWERQFS